MQKMTLLADRHELHPRQTSERPDLGPACWFIASRRALAPVAACGEANR